ncbi:MAG: hypothetical protein U1E73_02890 [Planctomycetota bacterium]
MVSKITANMIGRILRENGVTFQRTKTWKESNDRSSCRKKRITKLYAKAPTNSKVICVDEFGPVEVRPTHGHSWQRAGHPSRIRATSTASTAFGTTSRPTTSPPTGW